MAAFQKRSARQPMGSGRNSQSLISARNRSCAADQANFELCMVFCKTMHKSCITPGWRAAVSASLAVAARCRAAALRLFFSKKSHPQAEAPGRPIRAPGAIRRNHFANYPIRRQGSRQSFSCAWISAKPCI